MKIFSRTTRTFTLNFKNTDFKEEIDLILVHAMILSVIEGKKFEEILNNTEII